MKMRFAVTVALLSPLFFPAAPSFAVDNTAANLVAEGRISLTKITDGLKQKYPKYKEVFWNVSGNAFHNFSGTDQTDVIVGLSGYRDKGVIYNNDKQLVEDAGAAFGYFHLEGDDWRLKQVEKVEGQKYEGFEGADLTGSGKDQLVLYTSTGVTQMATVYAIDNKGIFKKVTTIKGNGLGPRVEEEDGKPLVVDFQRALVNRCDDCDVYHGRPYLWNGKNFVEQPDDFLDHVQSYDPVHAPDAEAAQYLQFFEGYQAAHPDNFSAAANCYDLSNRLGLKDKMEQYKKQLLKIGTETAHCKYCDEWLMGKNKVFKEQYLEQVLGKKKKVSSSDDE
jgi:hypothetical protein